MDKAAPVPEKQPEKQPECSPSRRPSIQPRRQSLPPPTGHSRTPSANRVHLQPASSEVISSLITSLSAIPLRTDGYARSTPSTPSAVQSSFPPLRSNSYKQGNNPVPELGFGVDYGAFSNSNQRQQEELNLHNPEDLAAIPPVVRTSKPPSGHSPLTAPSAQNESGSLRGFLRPNS